MPSLNLMIAGGGVLLLIAIYFYIRNQAKNEARAEINEDLLDDLQEGKKREQDAASMSRADKLKWLRKNKR